MQNLVALNTMYRKSPEKQNTYGTQKGTEKELDYILIKRRHLGGRRDTEANDMIHVVATTEVSWQHLGSRHRERMTPVKHVTTSKEVTQLTK